MEDKGKKAGNQKVLISLVIIILFINTLSIIGMYFALNKKIDQVALITASSLKSLQSSRSEQPGLQTSDINLPDLQYEMQGYSESAVSMTIISDLECPYCQKLYQLFFPELEKQFVNRNLVNLSYMPFPLESKHPKALPAAVSLYCADKQGLLWPAFHLLSSQIENLNPGRLLLPPDIPGIDTDIFLECVDSQAAVDAVHSLRNKLVEAGISGTPTVVVNGKKISGFTGFGDVAGYIDRELKASSRIINLEDAQKAVNSGEYKILDVRTADEFAEGHIAGAVNLDYFQPEIFVEGMAGLDKSTKWLIYCKSGTRSTRSFHQMSAAGFSELYNMSAGFDGWSEAGMPIE